MAHKPVGSGSSLAISSGAASTSTEFSVLSDTLRLVAVGAGVFVNVDSEPEASSSDYFIAANTSATLALTVASQRVVGVTTGSTTIIDFPAGTGSPFSQGDFVTLSSVDQNYYDFSHKEVLSVDRSSGVGGFFSTRITVDVDTSGITTTFNGYAELRKSLKVGAFGTGSGTLYYQQVQISGDA